MKIVLTGGPSAGKTTIGLAIEREFRDRVILVPESASLLFRGGFPRKSGGRAQVHQQRAIYHVQKESEAIHRLENQNRILVCDRGTVDGIAYWPEGDIKFEDSLGTTLENELSRYDWVMHLDTSSEAQFETDNPLRTEDYDLACQINEKIKMVWSKHPRHLIIPNTRRFSLKIELVLEIIEEILDGKTYEEMKHKLGTNGK